MQVPRGRALGFDADAQVTVGRRAGQAVGADQRRLTVELDLHRNMLPRCKGHRTASRRLKVERADITAFLLHPQHTPGLPLALPLALLQAYVGLGPGAGHQAGRRVLLEGPTQGNGSRAPHHLLDLQRPQALGTFECLDGGAVQQQLGMPV
ncbi:hypothetical protein D3C76_662170 [compost metagenome]